MSTAFNPQSANTVCQIKSQLIHVTFVDLPLPVEPYPRFRKSSAKMEGGAGTMLACFAVAQINPIRFTRGYHCERAAVALPGSLDRHSPSVVFT